MQNLNLHIINFNTTHNVCMVNKIERKWLRKNKISPPPKKNLGKIKEKRDQSDSIVDRMFAWDTADLGSIPSSTWSQTLQEQLLGAETGIIPDVGCGPKTKAKKKKKVWSVAYHHSERTCSVFYSAHR